MVDREASDTKGDAHSRDKRGRMSETELAGQRADQVVVQ
jgi:hypothetical protein